MFDVVWGKVDFEKLPKNYMRTAKEGNTKEGNICKTHEQSQVYDILAPFAESKNLCSVQIRLNYIHIYVVAA